MHTEPSRPLQILLEEDNVQQWREEHRRRSLDVPMRHESESSHIASEPRRRSAECAVRGPRNEAAMAQRGRLGSVPERGIASFAGDRPLMDCAGAAMRSRLH